MKKLLQIIKIELYDRGRLIQCMRVSITLMPEKMPECRKFLQRQMGGGICLTIREFFEV